MACFAETLPYLQKEYNSIVEYLFPSSSLEDARHFHLFQFVLNSEALQEPGLPHNQNCDETLPGRRLCPSMRNNTSHNTDIHESLIHQPTDRLLFLKTIGKTIDNRYHPYKFLRLVDIFLLPDLRFYKVAHSFPANHTYWLIHPASAQLPAMKFCSP